GPGHENAVFALATGFYQAIPATTVDVVDVGVPGLANRSDDSARIRGVSLVSVPSAVHLRSVHAYLGPGVGLIHGDLPRLCRNDYPSHPVTNAVALPHQGSNWHVVLAITFSKPGRYHLRRVMLYYTSGGQRGWQYQNLNTTITITAA